MTLRFMLETPSDEDTKDRTTLADVQLAHGNAWTTAHMVLKGLSQLIADQGAFSVPPDVLDRLELHDEFAKIKESRE